MSSAGRFRPHWGGRDRYRHRIRNIISAQPLEVTWRTEGLSTSGSREVAWAGMAQPHGPLWAVGGSNSGAGTGENSSGSQTGLPTRLDGAQHCGGGLCGYRHLCPIWGDPILADAIRISGAQGMVYFKGTTKEEKVIPSHKCDQPGGTDSCSTGYCGGGTCYRQRFLGHVCSRARQGRWKPWLINPREWHASLEAAAPACPGVAHVGHLRGFTPRLLGTWSPPPFH